MLRYKRWLCGVLLLFSTGAFALDGIYLAAGGGENNSEAYTLAVYEDMGSSWLAGRLTARWLLGVSHWSAEEGPDRELQVFSLAPVLLYHFASGSATVRPYLGLSVGIAYLTETRIGDNDLGIHWQFDNRLAAGLRFGAGHRHDLSVNVRHVSNAGLDDNNAGFDTLNAAYSYHF